MSPEPLTERAANALTEYLTVIPFAPGMYEVVSGSGKTYRVDIRGGSCECPDARYRDRTCKHQMRVKFETGRRSVPAWVDRSAIPQDFGLHVDEEPQFETTTDLKA
jgi:hypothetical protein